MEMSSYLDYIKNKQLKVESSGFKIEIEDINDLLFDFQKVIVKWSCEKGKSAIFADCGLGKTFMQLEWARLVCEKTEMPVLIVAPLSVSHQTKNEGLKLGLNINICKSQEDIINGINITNYEMIHKFNSSAFSGIVLDESSILKSIGGKYKTYLIHEFTSVPYKLACTATPSPNDISELGNHSEFLNIMPYTTMLSLFFYNDGSETQKWHIKGHAEVEFWKWVSTWAACITKPSDIGFKNNGFELPELKIIEHYVDCDIIQNAKESGELFRPIQTSATGYHSEKRLSCIDRANKCKEIIDKDGDCNQWLIWCDTNYDSEELKIINNAVEIKGSDKDEKKQQAAIDFVNGKIKILISKPSIFGFGLNFQNCCNVIFNGLSYSYESFYQATRRTWRFGQKNNVNIHIVMSNTERSIIGTIKNKEKQHKKLQENMISIVNQYQEITKRRTVKVENNINKIEIGKDWKLYNADCILAMKHIKDESIDLSIFSPPFASLYTYSDSPNDMGNCTSHDDFINHFNYLSKDLFRITKTGRECCIHCMNLPTIKQRDGYIGIHDFRGDIIRCFQNNGWIYHSEVTIWKNPVTAMQRTKALGLLHKQIKKDSSMCRQGIADYLVVMRKPGENTNRITHTSNSFPVEQWQEWASPVWMDINQSNTLQKEREEKDEKHICPLQLDVIERAVVLWSNENDTVFSPFAGIGSEGYQSLLLNRKFIGIELKESYFNQAVLNLKLAENMKLEKENDLISIMR